MTQSLGLAGLTLTSTIQIWQIILLALFQGAVNAIDAPTRHAICVLGALLFLRQLPKIRQVVRPIYRSRGLLPEANS